MNVEELLTRLSKVKKTGPDKWQARCPAHEDRSPSLAIKESGGKILLHCFAGCSVDDVCGAIGVELTDLFPPRENEWHKAAERPVNFGHSKFTSLDALRCLAGEGSVLLLFACDMSEGKVLSPADHDRLVTACARLNTAMEYLGANNEVMAKIK